MKCSECQEPAEYGDVCFSCCEHGDIEGSECLDCGKDLTQELIARAEAMAEGDR